MLNDEEFLTALENKLLEEVRELRVGAENKQEEIADIYEVLDAIIAARGFSREEIEVLQAKKRIERGGFEKRLFLEGVDPSA